MGSLYFANVTIGTPDQNFRLHIDTGSSDLWVNTRGSQICSESSSQIQAQGGVPCSVSGLYDANSSSTYRYVDSEFQIQYADQSGAAGDYFTDVLKIGGASVTSLQMGVGYQSTSSEGVMGIGYPALEVQSANNGEQPYANAPQAMVNEGLIQSNAYSLWLDDLASSTGSILFGGVDTDKYHGSLSTLPIQREQGAYLEMLVTLTGVSITQDGRNSSETTTELPAAVLLDSGSTLSYLPQTLTQNIYRALGVRLDQQQGVGIVPCSLANANDTIEFSFSGVVISVPIDEMILQGGGSDASTCTFGISPAPTSQGGGSSYTLGDTFIRSAYIVYDIGNNEISLANTNFDSTTTNIMEIGTGAQSVPDATGVASAVSVAVTGTATARNDGPLGTSTTTARSTAAATGGAGSISAPQIPLPVWGGVAGAALIFAL